MAMKVVKKADLIEHMKREHEERAEAKRIQRLLANDTVEGLLLDLWDTVKAFYAMVLKVTEGGEETREELYRQLDEFALRLNALGFDEAWDDVKEEVEGGANG